MAFLTTSLIVILALAANLGCRFDMIPIDDVFAQFLSSLEAQFANTDPDADRDADPRAGDSL